MTGFENGVPNGWRAEREGEFRRADSDDSEVMIEPQVSTLVGSPERRIPRRTNSSAFGLRFCSMACAVGTSARSTSGEHTEEILVSIDGADGDRRYGRYGRP